MYPPLAGQPVWKPEKIVGAADPTGGPVKTPAVPGLLKLLLMLTMMMEERQEVHWPQKCVLAHWSSMNCSLDVRVHVHATNLLLQRLADQTVQLQKIGWRVLLMQAAVALL